MLCSVVRKMDEKKGWCVGGWLSRRFVLIYGRSTCSTCNGHGESLFIDTLGLPTSITYSEGTTSSSRLIIQELSTCRLLIYLTANKSTTMYVQVPTIQYHKDTLHAFYYVFSVIVWTIMEGLFSLKVHG